VVLLQALMVLLLRDLVVLELQVLAQVLARVELLVRVVHEDD